MTAIAFCGLGRMGTALVSRLLEQGHEVTVWSRTRAHAEAVHATRVATSPQDAASHASIVCTMLTDATAVGEVVLGPDGVARGLQTGGLVIDLTTTGPTPARSLGAALAALDVEFVDAPVAGSIEPARTGRLAIVAGGSDAAFARARPLLELFSDRLWHLGPVGSGQAAKVVLNLVLGGVMAAAAEGYALAQALGLESERALDVLQRASVASQTYAGKHDRLASGDYRDPNFRLALMRKDLGLALDAAREVGQPVPTTARVAELFSEAEATGLADLDYSAVTAYLEDHRQRSQQPITPSPSTPAP